MACTSRLLRASRSHLLLCGTARGAVGMYSAHPGIPMRCEACHTAALPPRVRFPTAGGRSKTGILHWVVQVRLVHDDKTVITVLEDLQYQKLADETLDELGQFFEDLGDTGLCPSDYDVSLADGVLTINVGGKFGTYVINKQTPNKQIWLSSPTSGPKRYDVIKGRWRYSHDGSALHDLLSSEFSELLDSMVDLSDLKYYHIHSLVESTNQVVIFTTDEGSKELPKCLGFLRNPLCLVTSAREH